MNIDPFMIEALISKYPHTFCKGEGRNIFISLKTTKNSHNSK